MIFFYVCTMPENASQPVFGGMARQGGPKLGGCMARQSGPKLGDCMACHSIPKFGWMLYEILFRVCIW